jgi:hypothetical protein
MKALIAVLAVLFANTAMAAPSAPCPAGLVKNALTLKLERPGQTHLVRAIDFDESVAPGAESVVYPGFEKLNLGKYGAEEVQIFTGRVSAIMDTSYYAVVVKPKSCEIVEIAQVEYQQN